jgi:hypothetical protein
MFLFTTLSQPKCVSPQDLYTITLFLFIYSLQINNEKKRLAWLTDTFRTILLASITQGSNSSNDNPISIELENLWWIKTLTRLLRLSFNNREDFQSFLAGLFCAYLNYRVFLVIKKFSRDKLPDNLKYFWDDFDGTPCNWFEFEFLHWKLSYN